MTPITFQSDISGSAIEIPAQYRGDLPTRVFVTITAANPPQRKKLSPPHIDTAGWKFDRFVDTNLLVYVYSASAPVKQQKAMAALFQNNDRARGDAETKALRERKWESCITARSIFNGVY